MNEYPDFSQYNYQVVRELGRNREGGRISYLAVQLDSGQKVALKQFRFLQEASWQGFKTYEREVAILQELNHPRIPRYLNSFETNDGFCMVQEYRDAPSLATKKSFKPEEIRQILVSVLEILVDLQTRVPPIVHRDLKPENILVDSDCNAYLIDFGLARINTQEMALSSVVAGTPGFMPPEELFNRPLTTASDLYSLGATAIALLTNTPSIKISDLIDENYRFNFRHLLGQIDRDLIQWLQKMVAPNTKDRYPNAKTALRDLQAIDAGLSTANKQFGKTIPVLIGTLTLTGIGLFYYLTPDVTSSPTAIQPQSAEREWFDRIKPNCNAVEVMTAMHDANYPQTPEGVGYAASCYALAGRLDLADAAIQELPENLRVYGAAVVFDIGHPVADAGDDKSAGPIMDLVLKYWSDNYMALYHAGMSAYVLGEYPKAKTHLNNFLTIYQTQDVWSDRAKLALTRMEQNIPADPSFSIHH
jgi:serine/threonine protein kinase